MMTWHANPVFIVDAAIRPATATWRAVIETQKQALQKAYNMQNLFDSH